MSDRFQKLIFLSPGDGYKIPVLHFNLSAIAFDIPFEVIEIDNM
jgi:hypothetical protein